jgi:hypothetical protein
VDDNSNGNGQKMYTEKVFRLFQRFRNEEKFISQSNREERPLSMEINEKVRDNSCKKTLKDIEDILTSTSIKIGQ